MTSTREQLEYTSTSTAQEKQQELVSFRKFEEEERGGDHSSLLLLLVSTVSAFLPHTNEPTKGTNERNERNKEQTGQENKGVDGVCREGRRGEERGGSEGERTDTDGSIPKATATGATLRLRSVRRTKVGGGLSC